MRSRRSGRKGTRRPGGLGTRVDFGSSDRCKRHGPDPPPREVGCTASLRCSPTIARSCPCGLRVALRRRFGAAAAVVADDGFPRTEAPFAVFSRFFFLDRERERERKRNGIRPVLFRWSVQCSFPWMRLELLFIGKRKGGFYFYFYFYFYFQLIEKRKKKEKRKKWKGVEII